MMEPKSEVIGKYKRHDSDSGSPEVQVALLTSRINHLTEHLKIHKKDFTSRRGLLMMVGRRAALLKYLSRTKRDVYKDLIKKLGLRR